MLFIYKNIVMHSYKLHKYGTSVQRTSVQMNIKKYINKLKLLKIIKY